MTTKDQAPGAACEVVLLGTVLILWRGAAGWLPDVGRGDDARSGKSPARLLNQAAPASRSLPRPVHRRRSQGRGQPEISGRLNTSESTRAAVVKPGQISLGSNIATSTPS